jgi:Ca2+-binding EF-hand superfamily protein
MTTRILLIGLAAALAPLLALAGDADKAPDPAPTPAGELARDIQDIVYFTENRPVVIRLHIEVDGKPFQERWEGFMGKLFQYLDRDGDSVLSETEAGRAFAPPQLQQIMRGAFINIGAGGRANVGEMDADGDQKITLEEFINYYRRAGLGPIAALPGTGRGPQDPLTEALFKHLDTNKDGKLSKEELLAAPRLLSRLDEDDDELISAQELVANYNPLAFQQVRVQPVGGGTPGLPDNSPFFVVLPDGSPKRFAQRLQLAKQVLNRYDRNKDDKISRDEIGFDDATFQRLDTNGDGSLDATELLKLLNPPADLEMVLRLGRTDGRSPIADLANPDGKPSPLAAAAKKGSGSLTLALGEVMIDLRRGESQPVSAANFRQVYQQQFRLADKDKQGFITKKQVEQPQYQFLRGIFELADRDGDLKLTEKEVEAFADLQGAAANCTTTLVISDNGHGLFEMVDADRDGRLSLHELRTMWSRLAPFDRDNDGCIIRSELPRQLQVLVSPGQPGNFGRVVVPPGLGVAGPVPVSNNGPLWFRRMDRNGDGRLSPREFFGTREDFDRIDTNGDGEISVEEAWAADALFRKRDEPKR